MNLTLPPAANKGNSTPTIATPSAPAALNSANLMKLNIPPASGANTTAIQSDSPADRKAESSLPKRPSMPSATDLPAPESIKTSPQAGTPTAEASKNADEAEPRTAGAVSETADTPRTVRDEETLRDKLMRSMGPRYTSVEEFRLDQAEHYEKHWRRWGPYLSERQWVSAHASMFIFTRANLGLVDDRVPFERITRPTVMRGIRSTLISRGVEHTDGVKMASVVSRELKRDKIVLDGRILIATLCSDNHQRVCFSLALWNGKDKILKERLFGLTGQQGMSPNFSLSRTDPDQYIRR